MSARCITSCTAPWSAPPSEVKSFWYSIRTTAVLVGSMDMRRSSRPAVSGERTGTLVAVAKGEYTTLELAGHEVRLSNPAKVYFPGPGWTKLDLAEFYVTIADAALV